MNCEDCPFAVYDEVENRFECYQAECTEEMSNTES